MWTPDFPLMLYADSLFKVKDPFALRFKKWASMGPSAALRFQTFQVLLNVTFSLLLIDWMAQLMQLMKLQSLKPTPDKA